jgi:hypothetical protein
MPADNVTERRRGQHGVPPLAATTRKRLLRNLLALAESGNVPAMEALIRLGFEAERAARGGSATRLEERRAHG